MIGTPKYHMHSITKRSFEPIAVEPTRCLHVVDRRLDGAAPVDYGFDRPCHALFLAGTPDCHAANFSAAIGNGDFLLHIRHNLGLLQRSLPRVAVKRITCHRTVNPRTDILSMPSRSIISRQIHTTCGLYKCARCATRARWRCPPTSRWMRATRVRNSRTLHAYACTSVRGRYAQPAVPAVVQHGCNSGADPVYAAAPISLALPDCIRATPSQSDKRLPLV